MLQTLFNLISQHFLILQEVGDKFSPSITHLRQLLPLPKQVCEVVACSPHGLLTDMKGNKIAFDCVDKVSVSYIPLAMYSVCEIFRSVQQHLQVFLMNTTRDGLLLYHLYVFLGPEYVKLVKRVRLGIVQNKLDSKKYPLIVPTLPLFCIFNFFCK